MSKGIHKITLGDMTALFMKNMVRFQMNAEFSVNLDEICKYFAIDGNSFVSFMEDCGFQRYTDDGVFFTVTHNISRWDMEANVDKVYELFKKSLVYIVDLCAIDRCYDYIIFQNRNENGNFIKCVNTNNQANSIMFMPFVQSSLFRNFELDSIIDLLKEYDIHDENLYTLRFENENTVYQFAKQVYNLHTMNKLLQERGKLL